MTSRSRLASRRDHFGCPIGNIRLDWRTWIREKIIDGINVGHANVGSRLRTGYGYVQSYFDGKFGLQPLLEILAEDYGPLCAIRIICERLAKIYGRKYANEMLRAIPGLNGLAWSYASKGERMLTVDIDEGSMPSALAAEGV